MYSPHAPHVFTPYPACIHLMPRVQVVDWGVLFGLVYYVVALALLPVVFHRRHRIMSAATSLLARLSGAGGAAGAGGGKDERSPLNSQLHSAFPTPPTRSSSSSSAPCRAVP